MHVLQLQGVIVIIILITYILTSHVIQIKKIRFLHESVVAIILGIFTAFFLEQVFGESVKFDHEMFFNIILPPIIFAAGYNLHKKNFFDNFWMISYQGIVCTMISFTILSAFAFLINETNIIGVKLGEDEILLLTATLCATDTVAALTLVKEQYYPILNSILFGEGIFNDAVSILLFRSVKNYLSETSFSELNSTIAFKLFFDFSYLFILSVMVGIVLGSTCSLLFKHCETLTNHHIKETSIILLFGYLSYLMAELFFLSGIISLFVCGLLLSIYTFPNLSKQAQQGTHLAFDTVGYLAEAFVFAYLGITTLAIPFSKIPFLFATIMIVVLAFARFMTVFLLPCVTYLSKKTFYLKIKELQILWYSGLIRGAIAFALSAQIETKNAELIQGTVLFIVLVTTCVGSILLESFSDYVGLKVHDEDLFVQFQEFMGDGKEKEDISTYSSIGNGKETHNSKPTAIIQNNIKQTNWKKFEEKIITPFFSKDNRQSNQPSEISLNTFKSYN